MTPRRQRQRRPFWYHGWNIVGICVLAQMAALGLTLNCFSLFLQDWSREFHVRISDLTLSVTLFSIGCALVSPVVGWAAGRFPARWVFGIAMAGLAAAHTAVAQATAAWHVLALYGLVFSVFITMASLIEGQALVSRWFVRRVGVAMGLTAFGAALSGVLFPSVIVWLLPKLGWREIWRLFAAVIALGGLPLMLLVARNQPKAEEGRPYLIQQRQASQEPTLSVGQILRRRNFWILICVFVAVQSGFQALSVNFAPLVEAYGVSLSATGLLLTAMSLSAVAAKLLAGILADRFGNRLPLAGAAAAVAVGEVLLIAAARHPALVIPGALLMGVAGATWTLLASATLTEFGAADFGRAYGLITALTPIGMLTAPLLARVKEGSGSYTPGLIVMLTMAVLGSAVATQLAERPRSATERQPGLGRRASPGRAAGPGDPAGDLARSD